MNKLGSLRAVTDVILACFEGCTEDDAPLAGCFDAGSSNAGSERACFLPAATTAVAIGKGAAHLNNAGDTIQKSIVCKITRTPSSILA